MNTLLFILALAVTPQTSQLERDCKEEQKEQKECKPRKTKPGEYNDYRKWFEQGGFPKYFKYNHPKEYKL